MANSSDAAQTSPTPEPTVECPHCKGAGHVARTWLPPPDHHQWNSLDRAVS